MIDPLVAFRSYLELSSRFLALMVATREDKTGIVNVDGMVLARQNDRNVKQIESVFLFQPRFTMATARKVLVDSTVTLFYHCISRCVRRAFLCGEENAHRKQWIEEWLQQLTKIFAFDGCGFSVMNNHLHVLLRLDLSRAKGWSAEECSATIRIPL